MYFFNLILIYLLILANIGKILKLIYISSENKKYNMKYSQIKLLKKCYINLPTELLKIISSYHHCNICYSLSNKHCNNCNQCNINKKTHITCKKCNKCYEKYVNVKYSQFLTFKNIKLLHIHCNNCDNVKNYSFKYFYYYCKKCNNKK